MIEIGYRLFARGQRKSTGHRAVTEAGQLGKNEPHPVALLSSLPQRCLISPGGSGGPERVIPVSSANSRRAASIASSPASISPFGMVQAPWSLRRQYGPPGCARSTSSLPPTRRYIRIPALDENR